MTAVKPPHQPGREQLVDALMPGPLRRADPPPAPMPMLHADNTPGQGEVLAVARVTRPGG